MSVFHNNILAGAAGQAGGAAAAGPIKSLRFNRDDDAMLTRTLSSGNRKKWTWAAWIKRVQLGSQSFLFQGEHTTGHGSIIEFNSADQLDVYDYVSSYNYRVTTTRNLRDPSAWYHIVVAFDSTQSTAADRVKIYINGGSAETDFANSSYPSQNSEHYMNSAVRHIVGRATFNNSFGSNATSNVYLADVYFIDGSALDPTSFGAYDDNGVWQASGYSGTYGTNGFHLLDFANESTVGHDSSGNENDFTANNITTGPEKATGYVSGSGTPANASGSGGWDQAFDGSTSTLVYNSNGSTTTTFNLHQSLAWTSKIRIYAGQNGTSGTNIIANGTNLSSSHTWPLAGGWQEVTSSLTSPLTSLGLTSVGGQSSNIRAVEIDDTIVVQVAGGDVDVLFDVPVNGTQSDTGAGGEVSGNYCCWNALNKGNDITLSNGNLDASSGSGLDSVAGTIGMSSGKWYWEHTVVTFANMTVGIASSGFNPETWTGADANTWSMHSNGKKYHNNSNSAYGSTYGLGDVIGVAFDADNGNLYFYINGTVQNSGTAAYTGLTSGPYFPAFSSTDATAKVASNWGQRAFAYSAPSGYKALCTTNLPTPTIADGSEYFDATLYTGNGSTQSISVANHSPDFVWVKSRNDTTGHRLFDTVRGDYKFLESNSTGAEVTNTNQIAITSSGFSTGNSVNTNDNNDTYVAWTWNAGSSTVSNTDGSITSSVRANQAAGFSIVSYTGNGTAGATVGHGLNAAPEMIIVKDRTQTQVWNIYHASKDTAGDLHFDTSTGTVSDKITATSSTTFTVADDGNVNRNNDNYIAYCFAPVAGYSAFGSYTGNGSADGPMIVTGFRPALVILKRTDGAAAWYMYDYKRDGYNAANKLLYANYSNAEANNHIPDFLSNGFKIRTTGTVANGNGNDYLYIAFAENPFQANGGLAR